MNVVAPLDVVGDKKQAAKNNVDRFHYSFCYGKVYRSAACYTKGAGSGYD